MRGFRICVYHADDLIGIDANTTDIFCLFGEACTWRDLKKITTNIYAVREKAQRLARRERNAWVLCPSKWVLEICRLDVVRYENDNTEIDVVGDS